MNKFSKLTGICQKYNIGLVYLFGSQRENALKMLEGEWVEIKDPLTDIDVGVVFIKNIDNVPERYKLYADVFNDL